MSTLLKVAKKMEAKLKRYANASVFSVLEQITDTAMELYKSKDKFVQAVLSATGGGESTYGDSQTVKHVEELLYKSYSGAVALLNDAKNYGMDAAGMRDRKNQLLVNCHLLKSMPGVKAADAEHFQKLAQFELAVSALTPTAVSSSKAPAAPESKAGPGGVAHVDGDSGLEEPTMTSEDPSENQSRLF